MQKREGNALETTQKKAATCNNEKTHNTQQSQASGERYDRVEVKGRGGFPSRTSNEWGTWIVHGAVNNVLRRIVMYSRLKERQIDGMKIITFHRKPI